MKVRLVMGIDPGLERVGYGLVRQEGSRLSSVEHGLIRTPRVELPERLRIVHEEVTALLSRLKPEAVATERLLFGPNKTTAFDVAKALGVVLLAAAQHGLPCFEYSPPEIKQSVVGNGRAEKRQVQFMVTRLLGLSEPPKPDDVADALAISIAHLLRVGA